MNHIYRLCWNRTLRAWVPASELAKGKGVAVTGRRTLARVPLMLSLLSVSLGMSGLAWAGNAPTGGQIVGGSGSITQSGNVTTIRQDSRTLSLDWQSFDVGADQTVDFLQPGRDSIAVNRILGNTASEIYGHLNANGQVWLINPNGVLFGRDAQVNVGGIVASTLDLDDSTLGSGTVRFAGNGRGSVVNRGSINAAQGGYVALLGNTVSNQGTIRAQLGTVALGAGTAVTLTFADSHLMHLVVDASAVRSLVENRQLIVADGGSVLMTAGARNSLIASVVNNTGTVQAQTVQDHDGTITLLGGMEAGTVNVGGTLDASAPHGGAGGFVETSGAQVHVADGTAITTKAANGDNGTWLVDPTDFTIAASGGDITAATLQSQLAGGNVSFSSSNGSGGTSGNVNVNQAVTWSANTTLTLTASNNVVLNAAITNTGTGGKTVLDAGNAFVNNVGAAGLAGHWAVYSASPTATGEKLNGLTPDFIQYNATLGTTPAAGGNGLFYSVAPTLTVSGLTGSVSKTYDGSPTATLAGSNFTDSGLLNGDTISSATGTYSQSDVGSGLTVTSPASIAGFTIVNGSTPVYGYTLSGAGKTANIGTINAAQLYATIVGNPTKVYDGTTTANLSSANYYITGLVAGQSITVNQPSSLGYASADVNTNGGATPGGGEVAISASFASTNFTAGSGTKLSNYILPTTTSITSAALALDATAGYGIITPAPVYLSGVQTSNKTYDATTSDALDISNASIYGIVNGDSVALDTSGAAGNFADANAGSGKAVTLSGFTLTGNATKVADYKLILPTNLTASIDPRALTISGLSAQDKVYDGGNTATLDTGGYTLNGVINDDSVALAGTPTGTFSQSDVGNNLAVTVGNLATTNGNYVVTAPGGLTANITPATLTIAFNTNVSPDKIYDGTNYATLNGSDFTVTGMVGGEQVAVSQAPATYTGSGAPNVGTYDVTATLQSSDLSFANGAKAGNYVFNTTATGTGSITPAPLTLVIDGNPSRAYDGGSAAPLTASNFTLSGVIPGETITLVDPITGNYYSGSPSTPESNAGTWGVVATLNSNNYQFTASSGNPTGSLGNYILPATALGFGTITPATIGSQITAGIDGATKVYDGSELITLGQSNIVFYGFLNGDGGTVTAPITGTFATKNVGTQPLTAKLSNGNVSFTCGGGGTACLSNYTYDGIAGDTLASSNWINGTGSITAYGSGVIQQKNLYITLSGVTKQYDGNTTVLPLNNGNFTVYGYVDNNASGTQDSGWVGGGTSGLPQEGATITPTASFTYGSPNVSRDINGNVLGDIEVKGTLTSNNYAPTGDTQLSNYNLVYTIDQNVGQITPAPLYVSGVYAENKVYDGGNGALVDISNGQLAGLADVDKNAGAITLNIGNATASTADGISSSTGGTIVANSNGSFTASGSPVGGTFASANVGGGAQAVTTAFSLGGSSAGNYTLEMPAFTANITPRPLTVTGLTANDKTYDGTTAASFTFTTPTFNAASGTGASVTGLLAQDAGDVDLNQGSGTGTFATANANTDTSGNFLSSNGSKIAVTASGFTLEGDAAGNYVLSQPSGLSANIKQAPITLTLDGPIAKVYDGTTSITIPTGNNQSAGSTSAGYHTSGWVNGEGATITQTYSASYADADATVDGNGNPIGGGNGFVNVTANLVSSDWQPNSGTLLSNYALQPSVTSNVGVITPLVLDLSATRVYDATNGIYASLSGNPTNPDGSPAFGTLNGLNGDQFTVTGQGGTSSKDVGTYTGGNFGLGTLALQAVGGANADNYTLVGGTDTYTITKAPLDITGASVATKVYDGNATATVNGATLAYGSVAGDVLGSDDVTIGSSGIAGTFSDMNAANGKTVTINASDVMGTDAGNYQLVQPSGLKGDITKRPVTISGSRQYDGTVSTVGGSGATWQTPGAVSGNPSSGVVSGDTVTVNGGGGYVASANVGTYNSDSSGAGLFFTSGLVLSNANYVIAATGNTFTINPYQINLTGSSIYNGTATAGATSGSFGGVSTVDGSFSTGVNGETLDLGGSYALANGGNVTPNGNGGGTAHKQTTTTPTTGGASLGGLTLADGSGAASNYVINSVTYTVNPVVLSFTGSKTYDGSSSFGASKIGSLTGGFVGGDQLVVGGTGTLSSANAGNYGTGASGIKGTPTGTAQIGVGGLTLSAAASNAANPDNYTLIGGTDTFDITQAVITLTGVRQYDGTTTVNGNGSVTLVDGTPGTCAVDNTCWGVSSNNVVAGDLAHLTVTSNGSTVTSANVGTYGDGSGFNDSLTLTGSAAGNYTLASAGNQFDIIQRVLDLSGTRVYDGTTDAASGDLAIVSGLVGSETVVLSGTGTVGDKNVGTGKALTGLGDLTLANGGNGGLAGNYTLVGGSDTLTITPRQLTDSIVASGKTYDGNTAATLTSATLESANGSSGLIAGDDVSLVNPTEGSFSTKNAGTGITVTGDGQITGNDAGNYVFTAGTTTADIAKAVLDLSGTRVYDGTTDAASGDLAIVSGLVGSETVVLSGTGAVGDKNVGTGKALTGLGDLTLANGGNGGLAGNYTLVGGSDTLTITPRQLTDSIVASGKTYDGNTAATLTSATLESANGSSGLIAGDDVSLVNPTEGSFSTKNAGTGITVTGDSQITGNDAGNYVFTAGTTTADIAKAVLDLSGTRVYDGTTDAASGDLAIVSGLVGSETVVLSGTGAVGDKNVGTGKALTGLGDLTLANGGNGGLAGNYTLVGGSDTLTITPKHIDVTVTAGDKVYDTTDTATVTGYGSTGAGGTGTGVLGGDTVDFASTGATFADANAGTGKTVTVDGISASGADAGNYVLDNATATTTANITPYVLDLTGQRVYDATTGAYGSDFGTVAGLGGDTFTVDGTGQVTSKNVGTYSGTGGTDFDLGSLGLVANGSALAGNYTLVGGADAYRITPKAITVDATASNKTYDGTTTATVTSLTSGGIIGSDTVDFTDTGATFSDANAATGKTVTVDGIAASGTDAGNYTINTTATTTADITPYVLDLTGQRVYDATTGAYGSDFGTVAGLGGDTFTVGGTGQVTSKNVGTYSGTGGTDFDLGDLGLVANGTALASNYTLVGGSDALTITPKHIDVTVTAGDKVYDTTDTATVTGYGSTGAGGTGTGVLGGDTVDFAGTGATFADANAGTGKTVTVDGISASGADAGNYVLDNATATTTANITPYVLDLTGQRVYDATTGAYGSDFGTVAGLGGDTFTVDGTGQVTSKNVGTYSGTGGTDFDLGSLGLVANGSALAGNYTLVGGADAYRITPKAITVDATASNKTYDGTTTATVTSLTSGGIIGSDTVDFTDTGATFSDANAATGKTVTVDGIAASGTDAGNYTINTTATTTADIDKAVLSLTGTRVYDGTTDAAAGDLTTISGLVGNETVVLSGTGTVGDKNVGTGKALTDLGDLTLADGGNGGLASNYTLVGGTDTLTITPKAITVDATAANKTYDGSATATVTSLTSGGVIGGDTVDFSDTGATFADANAGTGKTVTVDGIAASGMDAGNYTINTTATTTADIAQKVLSLSGTRVYDADTDADAGLLAISGLVGDETVVLSGTGQVGDKNVGSDKPFASLGTLALADGGNGGLAGNYTLAGGTDTLTITPATLTVTGTTVDTKTYDGNTTASLGGSQLAGVLGNDAVTLGDDATGTFASPNAASGIGVDTAMTIGGADAGNYVLVQPSGVTGTIVPVVLDLDGTRVYDATTNAYASLFGSNGVLAGIDGQTVVLSGTGQVASKNVSTYTGAQFGLGTLTLADGGNGGLAQNYTLAGGTDTLRITPLAIDATATAASKTYDTTDGATVTSLGSSGVLAGDTVAFSDTGATFADANAGNGKTVTVNGVALGGADAGNYVLANSTATTTADITPYVLDLDGTRVYDATANAYAKAFGNNGVLAGLDGQTLVLSGTGLVGDKNVGTDKAFVGLGTLALGDGGNGGLAGNYTLLGGTDVLTITPLAIVVDATGTNKMFDNTTTDVVTLGSAGVLPGDQVGFGYGAANFANPNVANGTTVTVTGLVLNGADAGNYVIANPDATAYTAADITGARPSAFGISDGTLASLGSVLGPTELATPYGLAPQDTVGPFNGNKKRLHRPVERNVSRDDFTSGLALKVIDGGVRAPVMAMP